MTKKDVADFENPTKCQICDNIYADGDVRERDHCQVTEKYRASAYEGCNIKANLNQKFPSHSTA